MQVKKRQIVPKTALPPSTCMFYIHFYYLHSSGQELHVVLLRSQLGGQRTRSLPHVRFEKFPSSLLDSSLSLWGVLLILFIFSLLYQVVDGIIVLN